jgi:hypothetical protein
MLYTHTSTLHRTVYPRASLLFAALCFSFLSLLFVHFVLYFVHFILNLTQNAFLHKTLSSIPHSGPRRRPASTSSERLVRSMHSRKMLLGHACRVWRLGVGEHCQSMLTYAKNVAFPYPSLTSYTYAYIVGPCQCDFGHYPCHWLANYEMQPD